MFCFQCQETKANAGCTTVGICGKTSEVANLQDLLIFTLKGIAVYAEQAEKMGVLADDVVSFVEHSLFTTITNVNFDEDFFVTQIQSALQVRNQVKAATEAAGFVWNCDLLPEAAVWADPDRKAMLAKAETVGVLSTTNEDIRSLRELIIYGLKGIAAYAEHARALGVTSPEIGQFLLRALKATTDDTLTVANLVELALEAGMAATQAMALLDEANTGSYGNPEPTQVNIGVGNRPGILISGHDLRDLEDLLEQTRGLDVDVYTHGEMLPAHGYPVFKNYHNLAGNYGGAWYEQQRDFEKFNGPILLTTNCLIPPRSSYLSRLYTTGAVGYPGVPHIADRKPGKRKDFSQIIQQALTCQPPEQLEEGSVNVGFAHASVLSLADKVVAAVKSGAIRKFVVMAGCDGRHKERQYFSDVAQELPEDTIILTAGCAKYRYNKLDLGDLGGIPRVLDAGQCNDSYSLVLIAQALVEATGVKDINELPLAFDIAWYEQKAVAVLLALLSLGVKGIRLGPTLPAFLSPNVLKVLVENFDIQGISSPEKDVQAMLAV